MESQDVEILVHVAAPSTVADDATYRQLARAYLAFQPEKRANITRASLSTRLPYKHIGPDKTQHDVQAVESSSQDFVTPNTEAFCPESQELSFRSAIDNRFSPRLRPNTRSLSQRNTSNSKSQAATPSESSWRAPPSQISDSYPLPDAGIINVTPTRVLQRYLQKTPSSSPPSSKDNVKLRSPRVSFEVIHFPSSIPIPSDDEHSHPKPAKSISNVIPVTPLPPINLHKRPLPQEDDPANDVTHISSSFARVPPSTPRAESEPPPKVPKTTGTAPTIDSVHLARSTSDTGPIRSSDPSAIELIAHTLDIRPPSPSVSTANLDPTSLVSSKLEKLARDLSSRYKPQSSRQIDPFERGYWLVDCTSWSESTRLDTWVFLTNYLRSGLAGWGVWCRRDKLHDWMRFYCWGHVAKHIYLLMYLASGREIKAKGARWFDADGDVVLEVKGFGKR